MPLFTYKATNDDNKEVRGSIDSPDEANARKALEDLNLEVLEISEASRIKPVAAEPTTEPQFPVFAFEGKDGSGTVRQGTLQAATKYEAFKHLRDDQKLFLTMLSPVGVLPQYKDAELDQWQRGVKVSVTPSAAPVPIKPPVQPPAPRPTIGFTNIPDVPKKDEPAPVTSPKTAGAYHPLTATLRLYAGWLFAWYGLFVAVGYYSTTRAMPWDVPFVRAFYESPLIFSFIIAIFIFLMLSALHKAMKGGIITGIIFTIIGIGMFTGVKMLVP